MASALSSIHFVFIFTIHTLTLFKLIIKDDHTLYVSTNEYIETTKTRADITNLGMILL
jgi:hypothetical protein